MSAYDPVKIKKGSHKRLTESESKESECFHFLLILLMTLSFYNPVKTTYSKCTFCRLLELQAEVEESACFLLLTLTV